MTDYINNREKNLIAFSIDVEDWYHTPLVTGSSFSKFKDLNDFRSKWKGEYDRITKPMMRLLDKLEELNITATFFVVADILNYYPLISERLKESNHEIGCHGLDHEIAIDSSTKNPRMTKEKWRENLESSKKILENFFGREVIGYRAPGAYIAEWMLRPIEDIGFKYDSSIAFNTVYNKSSVTLKNIPQQPYFLNSKNFSGENPDTGLVELPWSNLQITKNIILPAGGAYFFRLLGYNYFNTVFKKNLSTNDTMFYIHPYDLSYEKIPVSNFKSRPFFWINKGKRAEINLYKILTKYSAVCTTCANVYQKFIEKNK